MQKVWPLKMHTRLVSAVPAVWLFVLILAPAMAAAATLVSQSYISGSKLPLGSIVSLQKGSTDHVDSATTANSNNILGVVVNADNSQLSISSDQANQVDVATGGIEQVLVSDINGRIASGDAITSSPISGVGMKATDNVKIIGIAQDSFPNSTATKETYKDKGGRSNSVTLGQVPVSVNVTYFYKQPDKTIIPQALQNLANALAGKKVNALPIIISAVIFIVSLVVVVSIIYSMIHSSIISVGRNPMAQAAVYRNVIQLSGLVIVILGVSIGSIYMVLTKF
jgi:hypothetical protein